MFNLHQEKSLLWFDVSDSPVILIKAKANNYFQVFNGGMVTYSGTNYNKAFNEFKKESIRLKGIF